jgi:hypothetical protein
MASDTGLSPGRAALKYESRTWSNARRVATPVRSSVVAYHFSHRMK